MRQMIGRRSGDSSGPVDYDEAPSDVFQQPEKGLLMEALSRPVGVAAMVGIAVAMLLFVLNHTVLGLQKLDDYALVAMFVAIALLLSVVLRTGEPRPIPAATSGRRRAHAHLDLEPADLDPGSALHFEESQPADGKRYPALEVDEAPIDDIHDPLIVDEETASLEGYQRALIHYQQIGDAHGQGEILRRLGHWAKSKGALTESRDFYMSARNCFRGIEDNYAEAAVLLDLGQVLESLGDQDGAGTAYREANRALLDVAMETGAQRTSEPAVSDEMREPRSEEVLGPRISRR